MATGEFVHCEICHKEYNPKEMDELRERFEEDIYRPGEDIDKLMSLSDDEKSERRREIEAIFNNPNYENEQADNEQ